MFDIFMLSFVQSITEFLPVSSSGHLLLMNKMGISNQTMGMDVLLHLGTLLAVLFYFRKDVVNLLKVFWGKGDKKLFLNVIVATLPILFVGFLLFDLIRLSFRSPYIVAINSILWGIVLWGVDRYSKNSKKITSLSVKGAFYIGCAQALALIPGTSRSGITMTCGRALGISREESARFSMILSIPTILMTVGYIFLKGLQGKVILPPISEGILSVICPFVLGMIVIYFLLQWVKKSSFALFAIYRVLLGLFVLLYLIV